jgi:hypothetical protein
MERRRAAVRWFVVALLGSTAVLAVIGAIFAALSGRQLWHSIAWAVFGGGIALVVLSAASGPSGPRGDPRTGWVFAACDPDSSPSGGWLVVGSALAALGGVVLFA